MKNIVVLKNLPSNLVEEAIVILKSNKYARKLEHIEKININSSSQEKGNKDCVIREAENVISNYITKIEKKKNENCPSKNIEKKYKKLKIYSICTSIILFFCFINCLIS